MAILGVLVDKSTISVAGGNSDSIVLKTYAHSLPATNPEMLLPNVRSIGSLIGVAGSGVDNGLPRVMAVGANASLSTVAVLNASAASVATILFDLYAVVFYSKVR